MSGKPIMQPAVQEDDLERDRDDPDEIDTEDFRADEDQEEEPGPSRKAEPALPRQGPKPLESSASHTKLAGTFEPDELGGDED